MQIARYLGIAKPSPFPAHLQKTELISRQQHRRLTISKTSHKSPAAAVLLHDKTPNSRPVPLMSILIKPTAWSIHGRHVEISPEMERLIRERISRTLHALESADILESEGGVAQVDVRLMNASAEVTLHPYTLNKHMHDTYLQRGALIGLAHGHEDALSNFEKAVEQLERKLHKWQKRKPFKRNFNYHIRRF